jgi:hypothetical protein
MEKFHPRKPFMTKQPKQRRASAYGKFIKCRAKLYRQGDYIARLGQCCRTEAQQQRFDRLWHAAVGPTGLHDNDRRALIRKRKRAYGNWALTFAEIREIMRGVSGLSR